MEAGELRGIAGVVLAHVDGRVEVAEALGHGLDVFVVHARRRIELLGGIDVAGDDGVREGLGAGHQRGDLLLDVGAVASRGLVEVGAGGGVDGGGGSWRAGGGAATAKTVFSVSAPGQ